jgi:hypothetical protein
LKKIAILQSNYIPWKGYFDIINTVDEFIIYDSVQFTKNDWRNRNTIQTSNKQLWLTIPVKHNNLSQKINETEIARSNWNVKHWKTILQFYSKAPYFSQYKSQFEELYLGQTAKYNLLSEINHLFLLFICDILSISTKISQDTDYVISGGRSERLVSLCLEAGATTYLSGPSAHNYINEELFHQEEIDIEWCDYDNYPEYKQLNKKFCHNVSILDLIFNTGTQAPRYMKSFC